MTFIWFERYLKILTNADQNYIKRVSNYQNGKISQNSTLLDYKTGSSIKKDFYLYTFINILDYFLLHFGKHFKQKNWSIPNQRAIQNKFCTVEMVKKYLNEHWAKHKEFKIDEVEFNSKYQEFYSNKFSINESYRLNGNSTFFDNKCLIYMH